MCFSVCNCFEISIYSKNVFILHFYTVKYTVCGDLLQSSVDSLPRLINLKEQPIRQHLTFKEYSHPFAVVHRKSLGITKPILIIPVSKKDLSKGVTGTEFHNTN